MKKAVLLGLFLIIFVGVFYGVSLRNKDYEELAKITPAPTKAKEINYKASFLIFTNGTRRDFSDKRYHSLSENVYIASGSPSIVYVKGKEATWEQFFKTLPMKLEENCLTTGTGQVFCTGQNGSLKFYINGIRNEDFLNELIADGDKVLVSFGNENDEEIKRQISKVPNP